MKNRIFIVAAILALLATACKKENPQNDLAVTPITISASYGVNDGAKVNYTESGNTITATWDTGDQLYVVYNGHLNTLTLSSGAGTATATFTGTVVGTPTAMSVLICYVRDTNNSSAVEVSATGEYTYTSGVFLAQDGTLASAAKCNLFYGTTTYGNGSNISCTFTPNTSMMKLTVSAPDGVSEGAEATLTYKSGTTELAKASFTVGTNGINTIYLTVPAGEYTGEQTLVYHSGEVEETETLSDTQAAFLAGQTYSKPVSFGAMALAVLKSKINNGEDCTSYLGQYVTATGMVQPFATDAIGIIAHIATSAVDSHFTDSRILVLSTVDIDRGWWGPSDSNHTTNDSGYENTQNIVALNNADYIAFIQAWNYSATTPESKQWFLPSKAQWSNILASLGENDTQTLIDKTGMVSAPYYAGMTAYWSSSQRVNDTPYTLTLYYENHLIDANHIWDRGYPKDWGWFIRAVFAY